MHHQIRELQEHHARRVQDCAAEILDTRPPIITAVVGKPEGGLADKEIVCAMDLRNWSPAEGWAAIEWVGWRLRRAAGIVAHEAAPKVPRLSHYTSRPAWLPRNGEVLIPGIDPEPDEVGEFVEVRVPNWW